MSRELIEKIAVTLVLVAWYFLMPQKGYTADTEDPAHITYILCHANIYHLAGNVFVLWMMKGRLHIASSITIAILCSYIPVIGTIWDSFVFDGGLFVNLPSINTFRTHRKWDFGCVGFSAMFIEGNSRTCFLYIFSNT